MRDNSGGGDYMNKQKDQNDSTNIAGRTFEVEDYQKPDELSSGLAVTHEQVSDSYMAGETFQESRNKKSNTCQ
jgi:hypothetical protein